MIAIYWNGSQPSFVQGNIFVETVVEHCYLRYFEGKIQAFHFRTCFTFQR